ncbi:hypothetical protein R1flu_018122 [Riccia fluitans]|uniref:Uncharacterized protein n=1 Tax=Riccia fluitans TaxID=41844 RepID=A0ABD1ZEX3_9MARC
MCLGLFPDRRPEEMERRPDGAAAALRRPTDALRMAARKAASALAARLALLNGRPARDGRLCAANTLKCLRVHFRIREWKATE